MHYPLLTSRLSIEPLTMADIDAFVSYRQDPDIARFQSWEPSYSKDQAELLINSQTGVWLPANGEWLQLAVHDRLSGALLGDLALHALDEEERAFELGFTFAKSHQRKGYAKEASLRLMNFLFQGVGAKRLIATPDSRNLASIALLTSLGFQPQPDRAWTEIFKNEEVRVEYFELTNLGSSPN